ncbi:hypothetical protein LEP1GSC186_2044 [Leptospira noguchii serovar Autumnalis str. ZUN142]|uniref:Uncharacterized protein n=1 Tax=Leptospira noguchii serovar Autumnalis str. ZUN142 TaxID=1085540 RepID=M6U8Z4_9LEPT|nr:hypothetical protein [Leptospira noguchii]EMO41482.1 hypothetical protein LEP1GSC186_2044 [Leptospira noguchii serovar Autumnalis str. ZUN142]
MGWLQVETDRYENGSGWILERDGMFGWIIYNEEIEDEFPDTFIVLSDLFTNPGLSVITLDPESGKIPTQYIPALAINDTFTVNSQAAMLSLNAQRGDIAIRTDIPGPGMFILSGDDPAFLPNWIPLTTRYSDWSTIQNKPTEYPSVAHDHDSRYYTKFETDTSLSQKRNISTPIPAAEVTEDINHRFVSDTEKNQWNNPDPPKWIAIQNKPLTFPPDSHDHDTRYYTKNQTDTSLSQKRNTGDIPGIEIITDSNHRFVTDAQIAAWNAGGGGLTNPLNQDINFSTGRILKLNNIPVAGWLDNGTPFYKKRIVYRFNNGVNYANIPHNVANARTNVRIIGFKYVAQQVSSPGVNIMLIDNYTGSNTQIGSISYDDTSLYVVRGATTGAFDFIMQIEYI